MGVVGIVIHGGAGVILREHLSAEAEKEYRAVLAAALSAGEEVLRSGGSALEASIAAVVVMEDSPLFNAGRGSVLTHEGIVSMDAAVMSGADSSAGAVAGLTATRNPIRAAMAVIEHTEHVLLAGPGADAFAAAVGLPQEPLSYFVTERRQRALADAIAAEAKVKAVDASNNGSGGAGSGGGFQRGLDAATRHGTVGAVALDKRGHVAAATSTGGMTNKKHGRVGDSPILGAGTWAERGLAVSATGHGECFLRTAFGSRLASRVTLAGAPLETAAAAALDEVRALGGDGGVIAISATGEIVATFNSAGMYRGCILWDDATGQVIKKHTAIFANDESGI